MSVRLILWPLATSSGAISGTATVDLANAGTLTGTGALSGASALALANAGTLTGLGVLSGQADITIANNGTLTGLAGISGQADVALAAGGTLSGDQPPAPVPVVTGGGVWPRDLRRHVREMERLGRRRRKEREAVAARLAAGLEQAYARAAGEIPEAVAIVAPFVDAQHFHSHTPDPIVDWQSLAANGRAVARLIALLEAHAIAQEEDDLEILLLAG